MGTDTGPATTERDRPVVAVLCAEHRPPGMDEVEAVADVRYATAETLPTTVRGADVLLVWDFLSTAVADAWPEAGSLRWAHVASAGVDRLLFPGLVTSDVVVTNSRGVFDRPMAEYVLGLVLAFAKDLPTTLALQGRREWRHRETERVDGREVLLVGTGPIGRAIADMLRAVGMRVVAVGRTAREHDPGLGRVHPSCDLPGLLPSADFVVVAAPLTDGTRGLFDAGAFGHMKPTARFVNVGRGPIVVEDDLVAALRDGQIAGAALDVFAEEPLGPDHPLWAAPNLVVSPHMSGDAVGWLDALTALFCDNFRRWRSGSPLLNVVDKELGYVARA